MNLKEKMYLYLITIALDIILLLGLIKSKFTLFDFLYIVSILLVHILFYISLYINNRSLLDFLHYFVFIYIALSQFCNNYYIILANILLLFIIQYLWIIKGRCILNETNSKQFGYGNELSIFTLISSFTLCMKFGTLF